MSSFIKKLKHPKTGKLQQAFCIDDYFGQHRYGYWFKKDGKGVVWEDFNLIQTKESLKANYDIFNEEEIK